MQKSFVTVLGKTIRHAARLRGGGSALPGLVVEKIDPNFVKYTLDKLPFGVVVISGTNGKTTTTKIVVELLEGQGLKVFTNRTGSNFTRGVVAALLSEVDIHARLNADIAVLELDEAYAVNFARQIQPRFCLLLNVARDQLDRFGEIDYTANLLRSVAEETTETVVLNREDPRIANIADSLRSQNIRFFGLSNHLKSHFPSDDDLRGSDKKDLKLPKADVVLDDLDTKGKAVFTIDNQKEEVKLKLKGVYNLFNAAAAISLVRTVLGSKLNKSRLLKDLSNVKPAFGRGESISFDGHPIELVLVKNPSGFRLGLKSFEAGDYQTMIAINDNYADGRDMSWLWDVDFDSLQNGVSQISGTRAYDMALRLEYDLISTNNIDTNLSRALKNFLKRHPDSPKRIYCTYTAMMQIRRQLSKLAKVEVIE